MTRYDRDARLLAAGLAALAGYVDAIGFLHLGGFFVSFMSGNSTLLAVGMAQSLPAAALAAGIIACFVVGVILGSFVGRKAGRHRKPVVLLLVAILLALAASLDGAGLAGAPIAIVMAMGAENAVFEHDGEVQIGLTYMTGTLVKIGQRITTALLGGDRFGWLPYLLLWLGLVAGATIGAILYPRFGLSGLWLASAAAAAFAIIAAKAGPDTLSPR